MISWPVVRLNSAFEPIICDVIRIGPALYHTFYIRLYGVKHIVKDHSDSERGNLLPPHGPLFPINIKAVFYMHYPTDRITHTTAFVTPVVEIVTRNRSMGPP